MGIPVVVRGHLFIETATGLKRPITHIVCDMFMSWMGGTKLQHVLFSNDMYCIPLHFAEMRMFTQPEINAKPTNLQNSQLFAFSIEIAAVNDTHILKHGYIHILYFRVKHILVYLQSSKYYNRLRLSSIWNIRLIMGCYSNTKTIALLLGFDPLHIFGLRHNGGAKVLIFLYTILC